MFPRICKIAWKVSLIILLSNSVRFSREKVLKISSANHLNSHLFYLLYYLLSHSWENFTRHNYVQVSCWVHVSCLVQEEPMHILHLWDVTGFYFFCVSFENKTKNSECFLDKIIDILLNFLMNCKFLLINHCNDNQNSSFFNITWHIEAPFQGGHLDFLCFHLFNLLMHFWSVENFPQNGPIASCVLETEQMKP